MIEKVQYIHCPKCNGIIKLEEEKRACYGWAEAIKIPHEYPRCSECHTPWNIEVQGLGTLKIILKEIS